MTKEEFQQSVKPGDRIFINSDDWFSNGYCTIKKIEFCTFSTQVRIITTDDLEVNTAWHFIEKVSE